MIGILRFNRFISSRLVDRLARTGVTPNALTMTGLFIGLGAAWTISAGTRAAMVAAVVLLHAVFVIDGADGELARRTGRKSELGRWLDVFSDLAVDTAIWTGLWAACRVRGLGGPAVDLTYAAACAGSLFNFLLILRERQTGASFHAADAAGDPRRQNRWFMFLESLAHNGISIVLAYAVALTGRPETFLAAAACFMNALWVVRVAANLDALGLRRPAEAALRAAAWGLGSYLLWRTFATFSWAELGGLVRGGGSKVTLVLTIFPLVCVFHTLGFYYLFSPETRKRIGWRGLYWIYLHGDALNKVTPLADLGGEPLKVMLLRREGSMPLSEAVQAVYLSRIVLVLSEALLMGAGMALAAALYPSAVISGFCLTAIGVSAAFLLLLVFSKRRLASFLGKLAGAGAQDVEPPRLRRFWRERRADFLRSLFWNEAAWALFFLEVYFTLALLDADIRVLEAFIMHAVLRAVQTATFFIPVNLGSQEGGLAFLASHVGLSSAHGIALSLFKRLRQWIYAGAVALVLPFTLRRARSVLTVPIRFDAN